MAVATGGPWANAGNNCVCTVLQSAEVSVAVCYWIAVSASRVHRWFFWGSLAIETCASSAVLCFVRLLREQSGSISVVSLRRKGVKGYTYAIMSGFKLSESSLINALSSSALVY